MGTKRRRSYIFLALGLVVFSLGFYIWDRYSSVPVEHAMTNDETKLKFKTHGEWIEVYRGQVWQPLFVQGVNLGATVPGHYPGEFPVTREDFFRWFGQIKEMGANVIRIYTRHTPVFYESLVSYNRKHPADPLYFIQGIWSPEELLIEKKDAFLPEISDAFRNEIEKAVSAVYGDLEVAPVFGQSYGKYTVNAAPYLLGWHIGTEWDPGDGGQHQQAASGQVGLRRKLLPCGRRRFSF